MRRKLVVGNWKMHGSLAFNQDLLAGLMSAADVATAEGAEVAVCVPFPYLGAALQQVSGTSWQVGAQDVSLHEQGAYTGEVSAGMLADVGAKWVIVGHSERRAYHGETDQQVADKAKIALNKGLTPIVCVGETLAEREEGRTAEVVKRQLSAVIHTLGHCISQVVVAYEPVWAIGTGKTASPARAQEVHALLRAQLAAATEKASQMKLLYGGSVKPDNAVELFGQADIDGGLIGGAALKAQDFLAVCRAAA